MTIGEVLFYGLSLLGMVAGMIAWEVAQAKQNGVSPRRPMPPSSLPPPPPRSGPVPSGQPNEYGEIES